MSKLVLGVTVVAGVVGIVAYGRYHNKKELEKFFEMEDEILGNFKSAQEERKVQTESDTFTNVEHLFDECFLRN